MVERTFYDSVYRYTDPVRYFKANDPYYFEVDNIPVKQLQENCNFLKGQIESLLTGGGDFEFDRSNFSELKPYVDGTNNIVKVKPGRYSARINDAYTNSGLQFLTQVLGQNVGEFNTWITGTNINQEVQTILNKFKSSLATDALNTNGLIERVFTYAMQDSDNAHPIVANLAAYRAANVGPVALPLYTSIIWKHATNQQTDVISQYDLSNPANGFVYLGKAEAEFVKKWRGIARTSIVNVENEIQVEIPPFAAEDFFYINESGVKTTLTSNHRIDLVFIYSKPIDTSAVTIGKIVADTPTRITQPVLGIVKGAGIGVSLQTNSSTSTDGYGIYIQDEDGVTKMLPSVADQNATNIGIGSIQGSFPSPDDLMNLSPLLCENLSQENWGLIGQTVLPVAYVVVRSDAAISSSNVQIIQISDLIDIRPFFRTTELAYNERSGIAAATPQISLANPVASEGYVDKVSRDLFTDYNAKINQIAGTLNGTSNTSFPRLVGCGYIKGGFKYGVEATLADFVRQKFNIQTAAQQKQEVISRYGYHPQTIASDSPDWDIAEWCNRGTFADKGSYPNDRINFHFFGPNFGSISNKDIEFAAYSNFAGTTRINSLGTDLVSTGFAGAVPAKGQSCIYFVKKRIQLNRTQVQWASDYQVDVQLLNCAPLSCRTRDNNTERYDAAGHASIWVDKRPTEFTIFVSWVARDQYDSATVRPDTERDAGLRWAGFSVINADMVTHDYFHRVVAGESSAGVAIYPTVTFQVTAIPGTYATLATNMNNANPVLILA